MAQYMALFRNRNFRLHWLAGAISNIGDFFNSVALVKVLSEDPSHLGTYMALIMVAKVVPGALLSTYAGVLADRLPRRTIMVVSDLLRAVLVLALVFVDGPALIIGLVFAAAVVSAFFNPSSNAMLPSLIDRSQLVTAGSLGVMTQRSAMLIGTGVGAAVLGAVGPHNVFYIDAASYCLSALLLVRLVLPQPTAGAASEEPGASEGAGAPAPGASEGAGAPAPGASEGAGAPAPGASEGAGAPAPGAKQRFSTDMKEAFAFIRSAPIVGHLMIIFALAAVSDAALNVLLTTFFTVDLAIPAENLGYVWSVFGGTSVVGALVMGAVASRIHWRHLISYSLVYIWVMIMAMLMISLPLPSAGVMALMGLGSGAANVGAGAALGMLVPDRVRGRVFGTWGTLQSALYIVGTLVSGVLADRVGSTHTMMGFSTLFLLGGIYAFAVLGPAVRRSAVAEPAA